MRESIVELVERVGIAALTKPHGTLSTEAELPLEATSQRFESGSVLVTSNLPFDE